MGTLETHRSLGEGEGSNIYKTEEVIPSCEWSTPNYV